MSDDYRGRYVVEGPPGTGKTTFLAKQVRAIVEKWNRGMPGNWDSPVLVCSLTRAAAAEVAGRDNPVEPEAIGTLHSHCYRALDRPKIITRDDVRIWNMHHSTQLQVEKFPRPRKDSESVGDAYDGAFAEDARILTPMLVAGQELLMEAELHRHRRTPRDEWPLATQMFTNEWEEFKQERNALDFSDLIEHTLITRARVSNNPWVILVDEAQDLSRLERELVFQWGERASAVILVGDPLQTIYGFRGSDPSIFDDPSVDESHRRVLSQSYRVPKSVLTASVHWIKTQLQIEPSKYLPRADPFEPEKPYDGWVEVSEHQHMFPRPFVREVIDRLEKHHDETVMIQATCAFMLSPIIGELRFQGVPFANPWKENRGDWNPLRRGGTSGKLADILTTCKDSPELAPWTYGTVAKFLSLVKSGGVLKRGVRKRIMAECKSYEAHPESTPTAVELEEWFGADGYLYRAWCGEFTEREFMDWWYKFRKSSVKERPAQYLRYIVQREGSDGLRKPPRVYVGTVHSFKGSEAGVVYVFPDLSPTAFNNWARVGSEEHAEIVREFYVAMTRSQEGLIICRNSSIHCAPLRREVDNHLASREIA